MIRASWSTFSGQSITQNAGQHKPLLTTVIIKKKISLPFLINCKFFDFNLVTGTWVHKMKEMKKNKKIISSYFLSAHLKVKVVTVLWFSDRTEIASFRRGDIGPYLIQHTLLLWGVLFHALLPELKCKIAEYGEACQPNFSPVSKMCSGLMARNIANR